MIRVKALEVAAEDRRPGIADGGSDDRELRPELAAQALQGLHADDQADAADAGDHADELARCDRLMPGHHCGDQKGENRRGGVQDRGEAGIDGALGPGDQREGDHTVQTCLKEKSPPSGGVARHAQSAPATEREEKTAGNQCPCGDQRHRRDGGNAELDESIGSPPERGEHEQERELQFQVCS
jgi:hypothetical protein